MNFQDRLEDFQRKDEEREMLERDKIRHNAERMENIKMRNDQPIDDSAVVDDMFGFLEDQKDNVSESQAPSAFRDLPAPKVCMSICQKFTNIDKNQFNINVHQTK